ncbi:hypothetical protein M885DRAFT_580303 [Pelagophyceae sp. CCMP2097]|nr:hypothetical protein M885DRAFT_580303 [Pelagophyceae sp. CCMP2097]
MGVQLATARELAACVRTLVAERLNFDAAKLENVKLLTRPRALGYTFNPISVYYVYAESALAAVVFEVSNTPWKDEVLYVHAASADGKVFRLAPQWAVFVISSHAATLLVKGGKFYLHPASTKTALSRAVEVVFHSKLWLWLLFLSSYLPFVTCRFCGS